MANKFLSKILRIERRNCIILGGTAVYLVEAFFLAQKYKKE